MKTQTRNTPAAGALRPDLGAGLCGPERRRSSCALRLSGLPQLAGGGFPVAAEPCVRRGPPPQRRAGRPGCRRPPAAGGGRGLRYPAVCRVGGPADRHHPEPFHRQGQLYHRHVCGAGAGGGAAVRPQKPCPDLGLRGAVGGGALPAVHAGGLWGRRGQRRRPAAVRGPVHLPDHRGGPLLPPGWTGCG